MPSGTRLNVFETVRPSEVTVTAFGYTWPLEMGSAYDWIGAAGYDPEHLVAVFPGMVTDSSLDLLWDFSFAGDFSKRSTLAARAAVGRAAGKDWWWAMNLIRKLLSAWPVFNGVLLREGVDSRQVQLADYLDAAYSLLWQRCSEEERMKLDIELAMLPAGVRVRQSKAARMAMLEAFQAD